MLIQRSYLDLSPELRRNGARVMRERLRSALGSPAISKMQQGQIKKELANLRAWEAGTLHLTLAAPPSKTGSPEDPLITVKDAEAFGLCESGVLAWMRSRGVDPAVGAPASFCAQDSDRRASAAGRRKLNQTRAKHKT